MPKLLQKRIPREISDKEIKEDNKTEIWVFFDEYNTEETSKKTVSETNREAKKISKTKR